MYVFYAFRSLRSASLTGASFLILSLFLNSVSAAPAYDKKTFSNFSILHADKLDFKEDRSELVGGVEIQFGKFILSSPEAFVLLNKEDQKPKSIKFTGGVLMSSDEVNIKAKEIEINLKESLFKCTGDPDVVTVYGKEEKTTIVANVQDYNLTTGLVRAFSNETGEQIQILGNKRSAFADHAELKTSKKSTKKNKTGVESITLDGNVVLIDEDKRIEAGDIFYWIAGDIIRINNNAKVLFYTKKGDPIHLFADLMTLEKEKDVLSASMRDIKEQVRIYSEGFYGKGRQVYVNRKNGDPDTAVLTGNAFVQFEDKALSGEEVHFDLNKKKISSLVGRPTTTIFSHDSQKSKQ